MYAQGNSASSSIQTATYNGYKVTHKVTQEVDHTSLTSGRSKGNEGTLHFAMVKKINTFYLRILHYTGSPKLKSVTVSLRTGTRYRAMGNADYCRKASFTTLGKYIKQLGLHTKHLSNIKRNDLIKVRQAMLDDGFKGKLTNSIFFIRSDTR